MNIQRLALVVLVMFLGGTVSTAVGEVPHSPGREGQMSCPAGSSCPDPTDDGGPCSPSCQCTCCPGHWTGAAFPTVRLSLDAPRTDVIEAPLPDDLHPQDAIHRIFHPPRA
jgi:hypothetical protein